MAPQNFSPIRTAARTLLLLILAGLLASCEPTAPEEAKRQEPEISRGLIVAMGDSLTAGLGVPPEQSYPSLLEQQLTEAGFNYRVLNAGVSGETSSGAKGRVNWILKLEPAIVIVETGANDGLRGIAPELVDRNIAAVIDTLLAHDVGIVLAGMRMTANLGPDYVTAFNRIYPRLASRYPVTFMPFFLEGVATDPALNQEDGIHPNAEGYRIITARLLPHVIEAIRVREGGDGMR